MLDEKKQSQPLELFEIAGEEHPLRLKVRAGTVDAEAIHDVLDSAYYAYALSQLKEGLVVLDVGAHIGSFSLLAAARGARVLAMEPIPSNYALLEDNVRFNNVQAKVKPFNVAAWSCAGEQLMPVADDNTGGSGFYYGKQTVPKIPVRCVRLDDVLESEGISSCDLLKLDCEGAEYEVLSTLSQAAWGRIKTIVMEYHLFANYSLAQIETLLLSQGFLVATQPQGTLGYIMAVRPPLAPPALTPLQPLRPAMADSPLTRLPLVGGLWRAVRRPVHELVVFYLNQLIAAYNRHQAQANAYQQMLNQQVTRQDNKE